VTERDWTWNLRESDGRRAHVVVTIAETRAPLGGDGERDAALEMERRGK
jgi:hypothetical protein